jgi:predicted metal-dependent hydrolase
MRLRFDERDRMLKLTHPPGVRQSAALAWAALQKAWIETQLQRALPAEPLVPGARIPVAGEEVELFWQETAPRTPALDVARLTCGGPESGFSRRIELFLKRLALDRLSAETARVAAQAGVRAVSVSVGDARTRWGSCTSSGAIRYSWRLILAPDEALRYVVAHEVAHLVHLNHGAEFRALERKLFGGDTAAAEALLRETAPRLRRIGRDR